MRYLPSRDIQHIAVDAGFSFNTVESYLLGIKQTRPKTAQRIEQSIERLGFKPEVRDPAQKPSAKFNATDLRRIAYKAEVSVDSVRAYFEGRRRTQISTVERIEAAVVELQSETQGAYEAALSKRLEAEFGDDPPGARVRHKFGSNTITFELCSEEADLSTTIVCAADEFDDALDFAVSWLRNPQAERRYFSFKALNASEAA